MFSILFYILDGKEKELLHPTLSLVPEGHVTSIQIHRAAGLITNALNMKEAIEKYMINYLFIYFV